MQNANYINWRDWVTWEEEEDGSFNLIDFSDNTIAQFWIAFLADKKKLLKKIL